jgi:hypothetical protein
MRALIALALVVWSGVLAPAAPQTPAPPSKPASTFAATIAALSEPGGFFDTDNLISNERSYLHVMPDLAKRQVTGGAYIGVGPDQNFSYMAQIRPSIAFMVDIRRDNLLLHLLFKALFGLSRTRVEYLALLTGRAVPSPIAGWDAKPIDALTSYIDGVLVIDPKSLAARRTRIHEALAGFGVALSDADRATIDRFHGRFIDDGLSLQFNSTGRAPQFGYPTLRDLLLERDPAGQPRNFLVTEDGFRFLKDLQGRDLVIPVVGNLSGPTALAAIAKFLTLRNERLSAFYASNVEFYLFRDGSFGQFVGNLERLPRAGHAVIIRSVFGGGRPLAGYLSSSILHPVQDLVDGFARGRFRQYSELTIAR